MLVLRRKVGECIVLGGNITISILAVKGARVKLGLSAPPEVAIIRQELLACSPLASRPEESLLRWVRSRMNVMGRFRSNHFAVNDRAAFERWCQNSGLQLIVSPSHPERVGFVNSQNEAGIPSMVVQEQEDGQEQETEVDFMGELAAFLADGHVAVVIELVYEGYRSLDGAAYAINNRGERKHIDLADIFRLATSLGEHATRWE